MQATPPAGKVTLYTTSTPATRHQKTAIRSITALLAAKNVAYEKVCARARVMSWTTRSRQFFWPVTFASHSSPIKVGLLRQVDLAEEPTRRSGMLSDSGGQSALPQLHVNGKVWPGLMLQVTVAPSRCTTTGACVQPCTKASWWHHVLSEREQLSCV